MHRILAWLHVVDPYCKTIRVNSDPTKIQTEFMDYIEIDIIVPIFPYSDTFPLSPVSAPKSSHPIHMMTLVNNSFNKVQSLDCAIIHRRLLYTYNNKIKEMCEYATLLDLPTRIKLNKSTHVDNFWICWKGSTTSISKGSTTSTHDLQLG